MRCGYGTYLAGEAARGPALRDEVLRVEQAGFEGIYFSEHHGVQGYPADPLLLAAHALGATTRLLAGPLPLLLPLRDPVRIAESAALAQFVSGGRFVLGLGAGHLPADFGQVGISLRERGARMDEGLRIIREVWSEEPKDIEGRFSRLRSPRPLSHRPEPLPPIWLATSSEHGIARAVRWRTGLVLGSLSTTDQLRRVIVRYRQACAEVERQPGPVVVLRRVWFGDSDEIERFRARFRLQLARFLEAASGTSAPFAGMEADRDPIDDLLFDGAPEAVAERMTEWARETGVDQVIIKPTWGAEGTDSIQEQLDRSATFCARVAEDAG